MIFFYNKILKNIYYEYEICKKFRCKNVIFIISDFWLCRLVKMFYIVEFILVKIMYMVVF